MFNDTSIIKEVNIINKVICYIMVFIMLIICNDPIFLLFASILFLLITKQYNKLFIYNIVIVLLILLNIFNLFPFGINKLLVLIMYTILLKKVTKLIELRYAIEFFFYRFQNKKITYKLFYFIYFLKNFNKHFKKMLLLKDDYNIKLDIKFLIFILKQSYKKAKLSEKDFVEINKLRFYNYSKTRTYIEDIKWESWDNNYLFSHIIIFFITFFYGR